MSCCNCRKQFSESVPKTDKILSTWNLNGNDEPDPSVSEVNPTPKPSKHSAQILSSTSTLVLVTPEIEFKQQDDSIVTKVEHEDSNGEGQGQDPVDTEEPIPSVAMETEIEISDLLILKSPTNPTSIPILEALSIVFEVPPLSSKSKSFADVIDTVKIFKDNPLLYRKPKVEKTDEDNNEESKQNVRNTNEPEMSNSFDFCTECAETLTVLYNSFRDFTKICKLQGEVAIKLQALEDLRNQQSQNQEECEEYNKKGQPIRRRRRRQPAKRKIVLVTEGKRPVGRPPKHPKSPNLNLLTDVKVKKEILSSGAELSDSDDYYCTVDPGVISSSPPDSPINLDLNEVRPRSPRPIRNSSARNKNWASFYKEELHEDEEEEEETDAPATEGTETKALIESQGEESQSETLDLLDSVQVELQEGTDQDFDPDLPFDDDDDDDEYRPDSDLEELMSAAEEGSKKSSKRIKLSRRHTSMFKSINRSLKNLARRNSSDNRAEHECIECGKCFAHKKSLERHCRTHTEDDGSVQCPTCNKLFSRDDHLKRHRRKVHNEDIPFRSRKEEGEIKREGKRYECPICKEGFSRHSIEEHVKIHNVEKPWKCPHCPMEFGTMAEYSKHTFHHEKQKAKCEVCEKEFRSTYHLRRHQAGVHHVRSDKPVYETSSSDEDDDGEEGEETEDKDFLDEDGNVMLSVPKTKKKKSGLKHKCFECGRRYAKMDKLTEHLISHGIGERHRCEICGREFNHIRSKQRHMFLHSADNPHKCSEAGCEKAFSRRDHLVRHLQTMHGADIPKDENFPQEKKAKKVREKEVQCPHCDKVIKRERLRLHMVIHTGEKRHMCDLCGQKFGLRTTLLTHIQCVHQGVRRYSCSYCDQAFKRSNHLKDHEKLHTDADSKPFSCTVCAKAFRREKNLKSHMICHLGSKDYMCELCGKAFNRIDNMRAHVKTVHQGLQIRKKKIKPQNVLPKVDEISTPVASSSVIVKSKAPPRKRPSRAKSQQGQSENEIGVEGGPGTIVTLAVDPSGVIGGEGMETVQIQEVREGEEDSNSFEPQRTTIVQLAPGQVLPQNPGFQGNYYYQYTYF